MTLEEAQAIERLIDAKLTFLRNTYKGVTSETEATEEERKEMQSQINLERDRLHVLCKDSEAL